jgi:hypothetical protein
LWAAIVIRALSGAIDGGGAFAIAAVAIAIPIGAAGIKEKNALRFIVDLRLPVAAVEVLAAGVDLLLRVAALDQPLQDATL